MAGRPRRSDPKTSEGGAQPNRTHLQHAKLLLLRARRQTRINGITGFVRRQAAGRATGLVRSEEDRGSRRRRVGRGPHGIVLKHLLGHLPCVDLELFELVVHRYRSCECVVSFSHAHQHACCGRMRLARGSLRHSLRHLSTSEDSAGCADMASVWSLGQTLPSHGILASQACSASTVERVATRGSKADICGYQYCITSPEKHMQHRGIAFVIRYRLARKLRCVPLQSLGKRL